MNSTPETCGNCRNFNPTGKKKIPVLDMFDDNGEQFDERLQCHVRAIAYDLTTRTGWLELPDMDCTDMRGAIEFFKDIDPNVRRIFAGDVEYLFDGVVWHARDTHGNDVVTIHATRKWGRGAK